MTAKEYLNKIQTYRKAIESYRDKIEELYVEASGVKAIVYDKDRVQTSTVNRFEEIMVKVDIEAAKMARAILKYQAAVQIRTEQIAGMDRADHAEILRLRYVELDDFGRQMSLEQISCIMHLSYFRVRHLHGEALAAFNKKYKVSTH